jgi:hypothetical protein
MVLTARTREEKKTMLSTPEVEPPFKGLGDALQRLLRPAVGFHDPDDVLKDPHLTPSEKRAILSSWSSDACAVEGRPDLRWMLGTPEPVRLDEVLDALARLDRRSISRARTQPPAGCSIPG